MKYTLALLLAGVPLALSVNAPRTWDEAALRDWATPVAGLNVRPGHFSQEEYDRAPIDNLRTYPVYYPGREPAGYWEMLQTVGPKPLIEPSTLNTDEDWVRAGKRVFEEYDIPAFRVSDPAAISAARRLETFASSRVKPRADGTLPDLRWIPTPQGLKLGLVNCAACHTRAMPDGSLLHGAPPNEQGSPLDPFKLAPWAVSAVELRGDAPGMMFWRSWAAPWVKDDVHESLKSMAPAAIRSAHRTGVRRRPLPAVERQRVLHDQDSRSHRHQGCRKYIDHTATHQHRGPGDLMRYAALVTYSDASDFGPYRMLSR